MEDRKKGKRNPCDCYVYDTSNPSNGVQKGPPMTFAKRHPKILGPILGKYYYVLSNTLAAFDFEVFDTQEESWTTLPSPPACEGVEYRYWSGYQVSQYVVVDNEIYLSTSCSGIFTFDMDTCKWGHNTSFCSYDRLPFIDRADPADGLWFAFPRPARSPLYSYTLDSMKGFRGRSVRRLKSPSNLVMAESTNDLVTLENGWLVVARSGYRKHCPEFNVTFDLFQLTRSRRRRSGNLTHPRVDMQYSSKYFLKNYIWEDVTISTCFAMSSS